MLRNGIIQIQPNAINADFHTAIIKGIHWCGAERNICKTLENIKILAQDFWHLIYLQLQELFRLPISNLILIIKQKLVM